MKVLNIHERSLDTEPIQVGALIDSLSSKQDHLWPKHTWPRMEFDRPLGVGAKGGHGPIRYYVEMYKPGETITFRFTGPKGFSGIHCFEVQSTPGRCPVLRHTFRVNTSGPALVSWPLLYRPLHDALIEDSLATAQTYLGLVPRIRCWSRWVRILRWILSSGKPRPQATPHKAL